MSTLHLQKAVLAECQVLSESLNLSFVVCFGSEWSALAESKLLEFPERTFCPSFLQKAQNFKRSVRPQEPTKT